MTNTYLDRLRFSARRSGSLVCMGLDPVVEAMPQKFWSEGINGFNIFLLELLSEMKKQGINVGAFKPNAGFYLKHDKPYRGNFSGSKTLTDIIVSAATNGAPGVPIILDYKRGDIASSSANYAEEGLHSWNVEAVTVSPYMGTDSVMPFVKYAVGDGKGVYVLCRTSNEGAKDFQDLPLAYKGGTMPLYEAVASKIVDWARENPGVGAVVGATNPDELERIARIFARKEIPLLIPGVGSQGGSAREVIDRLRKVDYDLELVRINSSSGLTHPWAKKGPAPNNYIEVCVNAVKKLNEEIEYKPAA